MAKKKNIYKNVVAKSPKMHQLLDVVEQVAPTKATVLITGESGTGKELIARIVHQLSKRSDKPFIALNCGAIAEGVLESELFGHEKGAFTGAHVQRQGKFEQADTGTIFLDEIGEMDQATQVRLLRVLEEREFMRVGGSSLIKVDARVIAATNKNLANEVRAGNFREDLYYRLKVITLDVPPLRERREDIPPLIDFFIRQFCEEHDTNFVGLTEETMEILVNYDWPGNIRELRNLVESMVVLSPHKKIEPEDIPDYIKKDEIAPVLAPSSTNSAGMLVPRQNLLPQIDNRSLQAQQGLMAALWMKTVLEDIASDIKELKNITQKIAGASSDEESKKDLDKIEIKLGMSLKEVEREMIKKALEAYNGHRAKAAEMLGIGERTLYRKIKEYDLG